MASSQEYADWLRGNQDKRNTSDYQTVLQAFREARLDELQATPAAPTAKPESGFMPALKAGATELGGGISALLGRVGLKDQAKAAEEYAAAKKRAQEIYKPTEEGWTEAPVTKFAELLGGSLPYMAAPLAAGAAAGALPLTGLAATAAGLGAAGLASAGQFTATNLARQMEEGKKLEETDVGAAALAAIPQAALDTLSMRMIPGIGRMFGQAGIKVTAETAKDIAEQGLKKTLADYAVKTGKTAGVEGLTESAQQVFERLQAGLSITDEKARQEYFDNFIGGAILGGTLSVPGRFIERGREQREARGVLAQQEAEQRAAEQQAEEAKKQDPNYLLQVSQEYAALEAQKKDLQSRIVKGTKDNPLDEAAKQANREINEQLAKLAPDLREKAVEFNRLGGKNAVAKLQEQQRVAALSPLEYQMEQTRTAPIKGAARGEAGMRTEEDTEIFPTIAAPAPEVQYAQQQMALAKQQDIGTFEAADFAQYLMQDPAMAQRLVENKTAIPDVSKKDSNAILGMMKLQFDQQKKAAQAATAEQLQQQQTDLAAQQKPVELDPLAMWKESVEQTEEQATDELLRPNLETIKPTGPATVAVASGITPIQNPDVLLKRLDTLVAARDKAAAEAEDAFAGGNRELGVKKSQEREAAQVALNNMGQMEGAPRALMELRKAQDAALMNSAQLIDDLKVGRTLGQQRTLDRSQFKTDEDYAAAVQAQTELRRTASSTPQTLINQINQQRDAYITATMQEAAVNRRLYGKSLTQEEAAKAANQIRGVFNEWVTRSMAAPRSAVLEERVVQPAQMRGTEVVKGAVTEKVDPRPLEERRFGAYRAATAVLQEQLQGIAAKLREVPRAPQRVEPALKMQFPATEAAKVAEERGETAKTLEGSLRRRRDYVNNLIDQAFQTRRVPGIAQVLLTRAQDFLQKPLETKVVNEETGQEEIKRQYRGTTALLDAAENIADRLVRGQNIERSDLVQLRDELRAESARPGAGEVVGEREGQAELFLKEKTREQLGVIRETYRNFENAPIVKRARAAAERARELLTDIKTAWDAADAAKKKTQARKVEKAETAVAQQRAEYNEAFNAALEKAKIAEITAKFQPQIDAVINQLALFGKEKAKALRAKEKDVAKDFETIIAVEREELQRLRQELADALKSPSKAVEPAEMRGERQTRGFTQPYEVAAAADDWVRFERDALTKAEAKLAKLQGPEKTQAAKEVAEQRTAVKTAEDITQRARTGLGLPGIRVERQSIAAEIAALSERIPNIKDSGKKRKAEERLARLEMSRREATEEIKPSDETASERAARAAEERKAEREAAEERRQEKETERNQLEDRALTLAAEIEDLRAARERARTPASKENIQAQIDERSKQVMLLQAQLETPELTRTEKRKARKPQKTLYSSKGVGAEKDMLGAIAQKLQDKQPLSAYEKRIWEGRVTPKTGLSAKGRKTLAEVSEARRREREEAERPAGTFGETLNVEDVVSSFEFSPQDTLFAEQSDISDIDFNKAPIRGVLPTSEVRVGPIAKTVQPLQTKAPPPPRPNVPMMGRAYGFKLEESPFNGMTFAEAAKYGASKTSTAARKELFLKLAEVFDAAPEGVKQGRVYSTDGTPTPKNKVGLFAVRTNTIFTPSGKGRGRSTYLQTMLHELTHAATYYGLTADPALAKKVDALRLQAVDWLQSKEGKTYLRKHSMSAMFAKKDGKRYIYGLTNIDEFLAELYANRDFQKLLSEIPSTAPKKSLLTRFVELMGSLFKFTTKEQTSVFAEALALSEEVFDATRAQVYGSEKQLSEFVRQKEPEVLPAVEYAPGVEDAGRVADKVIATPKSVIERIKPNLIGLGFRTQFIDKLAPIEQVARGMADAVKASQMMYYLRMYDQRMNFTSQAVGYGAPELVEKTRKDGRKEWVLEATKGANIKDIVKLLSTKEVKQAAGSPDAANRLFTLYLAAKRAENKGINALNFSGEVTQADLDAAVKQVESNAALKKAFGEARDLYNQYNRDLIQFAVQTGAINESVGKTLLASNDYIPYYRVREGNAELMIGNETPIRVGNLKDSPHLQELVGGTEKIMNFLDSSVQNTSMLLDMSLRNIAIKNSMYELHELGLVTTPKQSPKSGAPKDAVTFKKDGVEYYVLPKEDKLKEIGIPADLMVKGLAGIPTMFPAFMRIAGMPSRFLRRAVVASPPYIAKALFRDSLSAFMMSGSDATPVLGALKQIGKESALTHRGVAGGQTFTGMPEDVSRLLREMQEGRSGWSKALSTLEAMSMEADALTRKAQYESYIKQGLSEMEATLLSLESMNFSRRGLSPSVHMFTTLIPFMNSQIQSLDVMYRTFRGQMPFNDRLALRERMITSGMALAAMSLAYAAAMQDDDTYKNATPDQKYGNWFVRLPFLDQYNNGNKVTLRVPIPFELGYIFKALPEALYNTMATKHGGEEAFEAFKQIALQLVPGGTSFGIPQAIKPLIEVGLGKSFYTGRDIESAQEQAQMPGTRYRDNTSEAAKLVGQATNISPIKIEALVNGYTGSMGLALLQSLNIMLPQTGPEKAAKRLSDMPVIGTLFQPEDAGGIIDATYKALQEATQAHASYKSLIDKGEYGKAQALIQGKLDEMSLNAVAGKFKQQMGELTKAEKAIRASNATPEEKRKSLDAIRQLKIGIAASVRTVVDKTKSPEVPA